MHNSSRTPTATELAQPCSCKHTDNHCCATTRALKMQLPTPRIRARELDSIVRATLCSRTALDAEDAMSLHHRPAIIQFHSGRSSLSGARGAYEGRKAGHMVDATHRVDSVAGIVVVACDDPRYASPLCRAQNLQHLLCIPHHSLRRSACLQYQDVREDDGLPACVPALRQPIPQPIQLVRANAAIVRHEAVQFLWQAMEPVHSWHQCSGVALREQDLCLDSLWVGLGVANAGDIVGIQDDELPLPTPPIRRNMAVASLPRGSRGIPRHGPRQALPQELQAMGRKLAPREVVELVVAEQVQAREASGELPQHGRQGFGGSARAGVPAVDEVAHLDGKVHSVLLGPAANRLSHDLEGVPKVARLDAEEVGAVLAVGVLDVAYDPELAEAAV
mmetsp:Transcript_17161/g.40197  ORF Transcript_17161/g.40197 Transcript_17161/m.40197 type:complete len:390 (+) Transcript_17161:30-1199(+)